MGNIEKSSCSFRYAVRKFEIAFLVFLPSASTFKSTVQATARYTRIKKALEDESTLQYLSFVAFFATDSETFLIRFQSTKPLIHFLYEEIEKLLWNTMSKFVKSKHLSNQTDDGTIKKTPATPTPARA